MIIKNFYLPDKDQKSIEQLKTRSQISGLNFNLHSKYGQTIQSGALATF